MKSIYKHTQVAHGDYLFEFCTSTESEPPFGMRKNIGLGFIIFCLFFSRSALVLVRFFIPHSFPCSVCVAGFVFKFQISRLSRSLNLTGSKKSPRTFFSSAISSFLFLALLRHFLFFKIFFLFNRLRYESFLASRIILLERPSSGRDWRRWHSSRQ